MSTADRVRMIGATASPYTRKMVSLLRYRRIPYSITWADPAGTLDALGIERPKPTLHPTFLFTGEDCTVQPMCDSTPIIRRLEEMYPGRSVLPVDPALAFIDYLIEDFADEWCTKFMFHYRWYQSLDAEIAGTLLPLCMDVTTPPDTLATFKKMFTERQVGRLYVVGSNDTTASAIDASYRRVLAVLEAHLSQKPFMLGARPGAGDFAMFGQLTQLVGFDPTPRAIAHEVSPRTVAWVARMEDQSGLEPKEGDWTTLESIPDTLRRLLAEIGRVYVPALRANARAVAAGEKNWQCLIDGTVWTQQTFPYQAKCLTWIIDQYRALTAADRKRVDAALAGTGCEAAVAAV